MQEETFIAWAKQLEHPSLHILKGIGDDTAVLQLPLDQPLLVSTDMLVEGVHFSNRLSAHAVGWKSLAVNLSDIAAMGGIPAFYLLSVGLPPETPTTWITDFFTGLSDCSIQYPISLIGGDTVRSPLSKVINIVVMGSCLRPVYRTGAQPGDILIVTGDFGAAAAGLSALQHHQEHLYPRLVEKQAYPRPRLAEAQALVQQCPRLALLDTSDGLGRSLQLICQEPGLGCNVDVTSVPILPEVKQWAAQCGQSWQEWVIQGGEEYELLAAIPPEVQPFLRGDYAVIGHITDQPGVRFKTPQGTIELDAHPAGFQHF